MKNPEVSVVMSVYNGTAHLDESVESILSQEDVDFEFIIIDDGSADNSGKILDEYAKRDSRIRVFHQQNQGLTKALIRGCTESRGKYIARQDCGDISLTGRLWKQIELMRRNSDAALVSCGTRYIGPQGEHLFDSVQNSREATNNLLTLDLEKLRGPSHHGSSLFPVELYRKIGGYRPHFYFAQDLDLWIRLTEHGPHLVIPEILYEASLNMGAISSLYRKEQIGTARIILECARLRRRGLSEHLVLERAGVIEPRTKQGITRLEQARALYFIGSCLKKRGDKKAKYYFGQAFMKFPFHLKAAVRLMGG